MSVPADVVARELRSELEARIASWEAERTQLLKAPARIAELDALIAFAKDDAKTEFRVAPRPTRESLIAQPVGVTSRART